MTVAKSLLAGVLGAIVWTGCGRAAPPASGGAAAAQAAAPVAEAVVQPGAPGQDSKVLPAGEAPKFHDADYTAADVAFMQGMIHHHMQALQMVALIPSRTSNHELQLLGDKIQISQSDEIKAMTVWLTARGQAVPKHTPQGMMLNGKPMGMMSGMLTPAQMNALAAAHGAVFDRLFLTGMIQHHTGALQMVADLRAQPGSGLEPNMADFATSVDTDQRMEIDRMNGLLGRPAK